VARVFKFVDLAGCVLHTKDDPEDQLPIPAYGQEVSIGPMEMLVVSVMLSSISPQTYCVRVRTAEKDGAPGNTYAFVENRLARRMIPPSVYSEGGDLTQSHAESERSHSPLSSGFARRGLLNDWIAWGVASGPGTRAKIKNIIDGNLILG
jgi:hypothetical protein